MCLPIYAKKMAQLLQYQFPTGMVVICRQSIWNHFIVHFGFSQKIIPPNEARRHMHHNSGCLFSSTYMKRNKSIPIRCVIINKLSNKLIVLYQENSHISAVYCLSHWQKRTKLTIWAKIVILLTWMRGNWPLFVWFWFWFWWSLFWGSCSTDTYFFRQFSFQAYENSNHFESLG